MMTAVCPYCGDEFPPGSDECPSCALGIDALGTKTTIIIPAPERVNPTLELLRSETLGDFEILQLLGRGGMADVYLAHDLSLNRKVAIKALSPSLAAARVMRERF